MPPPISVRRCRDKNYRCLYNADDITEVQVRELLADDGAALFADKKLITETSNGHSYRVSAGGRALFVKEYKPKKLHRRVMERFRPACYASFDAGVRMLKAELPTPCPVLAVVMTTGNLRRQLLVTHFCEKASGLDTLLVSSKNPRRTAIMDQLAVLLADFHCKGFYSRHLRSANILININTKGLLQFWFVDLDRMSRNHYMSSKVFIGTVSRACFEFYAEIKPDERQYLLRSCFDAALKQNIFRRPSQQRWFIENAISQVGKRS